jgi:L-iditol 2-dehydrogenase
VLKAFVKYGKRPLEAKLQEVPDPRPSDHEVVLKVAGCGICGSDLHAFRGAPGYEWVHPPVILGHEFAGTVVSAGSAVCRYQKGDRVVVVGIQGCRDCPACKAGDTNLCHQRKVIGLDMNGGMAEFVAVNEAYLIHVPDIIDLTMAALVEPFSVAVQALSKIVLHPGQNVVVTGPGPIGLFCAIVAKLSGAHVLMIGAESDAQLRLPVAEHLGFSTVNIDRQPLDRALKSAFGKNPPDAWIEASGQPRAFKTAMDWVRRGGSIVIVGMYAEAFSWFPTIAVRAGYSLYFSYASAARDYHFAMNLMAGGAVDLNCLTRFFSLDKADEAFAEADQGRTIKPILVP